MSADPPSSELRASAPTPVSPRGFATGITLLAVVTAAASLPASVWPYLAAQWSFTYELGFRQRALVGSAAQAVLGDRPVTLSMVTAAAGVVLVLVVAGFVRVATVAWTRRPTLDTLLVACCLVVGPGALKFLASEHGRFDQMTYALVVIGLVWLLMSRSTRGRVPLAMVTVAGMAGVAIHEVFLLTGLPVLAVAWVLRYREPTDLRSVVSGAILTPVAVTMLPAVVVLGWIQQADRLDETEVVAIGGELSELTGLEPRSLVEAAVRIHSRTLADNVRYTGERLRERGHAPTLIGLAAVAPAAFVGMRSMRSRRRAGLLGAGGVAVVAAAAVAPLGLVVVGHDWARWLGLAVTNLLLLALFEVARHRPAASPYPPRGPSEPRSRTDVAVLIAVVLSALLPPIHWSGAIPRLEPAVDLLRSLW